VDAVSIRRSVSVLMPAVRANASRERDRATRLDRTSSASRPPRSIVRGGVTFRPR
jgi:hypothetical protein